MNFLISIERVKPALQAIAAVRIESGVIHAESERSPETDLTFLPRESGRNNNSPEANTTELS